jgi:hypothetical protein
MTTEPRAPRTHSGVPNDAGARRAARRRRRSWGPGSGIGRVVPVREARWRTGVAGGDAYVAEYLGARHTAAVVDSATRPRIDLGTLIGTEAAVEDTAAALAVPTVLERGTLG